MIYLFIVSLRRRRRSTRSHTLVPYTPLFRSAPAPSAIPAPASAPTATAPVRARAGEHPTYTRLVFDWLERVEYALATEGRGATLRFARRSEEHTSELQSLMRISYAVFCLKKKKI